MSSGTNFFTNSTWSGDWETTGTGSINSSESTTNIVGGGGGYNVTGGTDIAGTITVSSQDISSNTTHINLVDNGSGFEIASGTTSSQSSGSSSFETEGGGSITQSGDNEETQWLGQTTQPDSWSGVIDDFTQSSNESSSYFFSSLSTHAGSDWVTSGTGNVTGSSGSTSTWSGGGSYSHTVQSDPDHYESGRIDVTGGYRVSGETSDSSDYRIDFAISGATDEWQTTGGHFNVDGQSTSRFISQGYGGTFEHFEVTDETLSLIHI